MSTQFISLAAPPGPSVLTFNRRSTSSPPPESIPLPFQEAMSIRDTVFVDEQQGCFERELDADDPRSWHWVVYASISGPKPDVSPNVEEDGGGSELTGRKKSKGGRLAVGTIRLVPPPHPPHPEPHSEHMIDNAEGLEEPNAGVVSPEKFDRATSMHDGIEPYIKLGRLATLKEYRGLGLGRLLVNTALEWAGKNRESVEAQAVPEDPVERERERSEREGQTSLEIAEKWKGLVLVHAQTDKERFYERMGFKKDEGMGEWFEEGTRHVGMWRRLDVA